MQNYITQQLMQTYKNNPAKYVHMGTNAVLTIPKVLKARMSLIAAKKGIKIRDWIEQTVSKEETNAEKDVVDTVF